MSETELAEPRMSRLAIGAAAGTGLAGVIMLLGWTGVLEHIPEGIRWTLADIMFVTVLMASVAGIAAVIVIARSNGKLVGAWLAIAAVAGPTVIGFVAGISALAEKGVGDVWGDDWVCQQNLGEIGRAFSKYAQQHSDELPEPGKWCDRLAPRFVSFYELQCYLSGAQYGESSYALNQAVAGMKLSEIPGDIVLAFEVANDDGSARVPLKTRASAASLSAQEMEERGESLVYQSRWNQVCGPERLTVANHEGQCHILFGNLHTKLIPAERLPYLRWTLEGNAEIPASVLHPPVGMADSASMKWVIRMGAAALLCTLFLVVTRVGTWPIYAASIVPAAAIGGYFGRLAEEAYSLPCTVRHPGMITGIIAGIFAAIAYSTLVGKWSTRITGKRDVMLHAIGWGMATGLTCAIAVHAVLLTVSISSESEGLFYGVYFGIFGGALVGSIAGLVVSLTRSEKSEMKSEKCEAGREEEYPIANTELPGTK